MDWPLVVEVWHWRGLLLAEWLILLQGQPHIDLSVVLSLIHSWSANTVVLDSSKVVQDVIGPVEWCSGR